MLNSSQYKSFSQLDPNNEIFFDHVPYIQFDLSQIDLGEVVFSDKEKVVEVLNPIRIFGKPEKEESLNRAKGGFFNMPSKKIRLFNQSKIVGWRSLITKNGFFQSSQNLILSQHNKVYESHSDGYGRIGNELYRASSLNDERLESGYGLFLTFLEPGNHGSFIFRALPKIALFSRSGLKVDYIVAPDKSDAVRTALSYFGLGHIPLISCKESIGMTFENLYVLDDFDLEGVIDDEIAEVLETLNSTVSPHKKIYISRMLSLGSRPRYRPLINEQKVETFLKSKGFFILRPESYTFSDQINFFASADFIIGPSGSGMLNSVFAKAGTNVIDMESFTYTIGQHAKIYGSTKKNYSFLFGNFEDDFDYEPLRKWSVSLDLLDLALDFYNL